MTAEHWKDASEDRDYPAAIAYLTLLVGEDPARKLVKRLRKQKELVHFAAKDILRASGLPLLHADDPDVAADLKKIDLGLKLSPVLLVQGEPLWIADGYHRVCLGYLIDDRSMIPCRMVERPS
jgi:hypothetical protein